MKYIVIVIVLTNLIPSLSISQYSVNTFSDSYEEIEDYSSIALETFGNRSWSKEFELPFEFNYFDTTFSSFTLDFSGTGSFENQIDFSMRLMVFGYEFDNVTDPNNLPSDVRYKFGTEEGRQYLVIQYTKTRLISDPSVDQHDSHVNFQLWFFEDGTIEIRFGPSDLDNSPVYIPGEGFYLLTGNAGPIPLGPQLALYHPFDESIRLEYNDLDSHEEYELNRDGSGSIDWWPPEGWVIQFRNEIVSSVESLDYSDILIFPNPVMDQLNIVSIEKVHSISIFSMSGKLCIEQEGKVANVSGLGPGLYVLKIKMNSNIILNKLFLKI